MSTGADELRRPYDVSAGAVRPLMRTFWSSQGWRDVPPSREDLDRGVEAGLMFREPRTLDHDGWIRAARDAVAAVSAQDVAEAFIAGLTTGRLDLRSALGSFAIARHLNEHPFTPTPGHFFCAVCGQYPGTDAQDLNVLNFERFMWGGVRRDDIAYIAFDLEQFSLAPPAPVTEQSLTLGRALLAEIEAASPTTTITQLATGLRLLGGNKDTRRVLLEILGVCGILAPADHPGYNRGYIPACERELAPGHHMDTAYPACWWRARDGINREALATFLPMLTS